MEKAEMTNLETIKYILQGYLKDYLEQSFSWAINPNENENTLEIHIQKEKESSTFLLLRMGVSIANQEIYIYNIFLPNEDRRKGIGLGLIDVLFRLSTMVNYSLVLYSMTESFYNAMLKRGATKTLLDDCLMVTEETDLS